MVTVAWILVETDSGERRSGVRLSERGSARFLGGPDGRDALKGRSQGRLR